MEAKRRRAEGLSSDESSYYTDSEEDIAPRRDGKWIHQLAGQLLTVYRKLPRCLLLQRCILLRPQSLLFLKNPRLPLIVCPNRNPHLAVIRTIGGWTCHAYRRRGMMLMLDGSP